METTYAYYKTDLANIIEQCQDYIDQIDSEEEQQCYQNELNEVCGDFYRLTNSGVFHDAIGKVIDRTPYTVVVTTDY